MPKGLPNAPLRILSQPFTLNEDVYVQRVGDLRENVQFEEGEHTGSNVFFTHTITVIEKKKNHTRFCLSVQHNPFKTELLAHLRHAVPFTR